MGTVSSGFTVRPGVRSGPGWSLKKKTENRQGLRKQVHFRVSHLFFQRFQVAFFAPTVPTRRASRASRASPGGEFQLAPIVLPLELNPGTAQYLEPREHSYLEPRERKFG